MKLEVTGVETIEITDPKGICHPTGMPVQQQPRQTGLGGYNPNYDLWPHPSNPSKIHVTSPSTFFRETSQPGTGDVGDSWERGVTGRFEPQKWEKNWQSKAS